MKTCGVICEFNPFHGGHAHLLSELRRGGAETVICLMSGSFVQRGEPAVADKFTRARCAVEGGADIVLELPFPYSSSSAELFARAGVSVLDRLGVDTLGLGCETLNEAALRRVARVLCSPELEGEYRRLCRAGRGSAAAYFEAYRIVAGEPLSEQPNDALAVNYAKELCRRGSGMALHVVRRLGDGYNERDVGRGAYPSARALRERMSVGGLESVHGLVPEATLAALREAENDGLFMSHIKNIEGAMLTYLRVCDVETAFAAADVGDGLAARLCAAARRACSYDELLRLASAANYTDARIRRAVLAMLLGVTREDQLREPAYVQLLGANARGREFLAACRRRAGLEIVTKPADAATVSGGERQWELAQRSEALWCMTLPRPRPSDILTRMHPYFC